METKERKINKDTLKKVGIGVAIGTGVGLLIGGIAVLAVTSAKHNSGSWSSFESTGGPKIYNNDIVNHVKAHSTLKDRMNPGKMVDMAFVSFDILNGSIKGPKESDWKYKFVKHDGFDNLNVDVSATDYTTPTHVRN